ncbi:chemotaxis protein CheA [Rhodoferax sp. 4810]|uniref:Chemotaxis protein CheA n=1 Tax=Thiospirillum jenense TaxID=1653858 RepID=A0A839H4B8_9GAMM|nr:chemotaxis protein CheA [Thiospirillum jenense]MBB1073215.1 chemotaxis protein CheA [Rhodoferax jenense]MBB1124624.1 chemotaxis protein CheA [Thiospirillum jenense]
MISLLQQFLTEAREILEAVGDQLIGLETAPHDAARINELFRLVHTLKGNSGLFDFPDLTKVLHSAEDLMDAVRNEQITYTQTLADHLLAAADFISILLDEIQTQGCYTAERATEAQTLITALRTLRHSSDVHSETTPPPIEIQSGAPANSLLSRNTPTHQSLLKTLAILPESERMTYYRQLAAGMTNCWVRYQPEEECFYKGEDPFFLITQLPTPSWRRVSSRESWPALFELDAYRCNLEFELIVTAPIDELFEHFRYIPEQVIIEQIVLNDLIWPLVGIEKAGIALDDFIRTAQTRLATNDLTGLRHAVRTLLELTAPESRIASALRWLLLTTEITPLAHTIHHALLASIAPSYTLSDQNATPPAAAINTTAALDPLCFAVQQDILTAARTIAELTDTPPHWAGRMHALASGLAGLFTSLDQPTAVETLKIALEQSLMTGTATPMQAWLAAQSTSIQVLTETITAPAPQISPISNGTHSLPAARNGQHSSAVAADDDAKFGRRAEDNLPAPRTLKVDQGKVDRLMNLIGEMVVAKNALPYLAGRAENLFGVRELAREIKAQYAVINRIAEDMQDAIMQVRMMPVSFVLQRFPRLVRDLARKLNKDVQLTMEGEDTEADKNIIEALADPLVHCVRNSLDHGLETSEQRRAVGKSTTGHLIIRATTVSDRVVIEIIDDGRGIDAQVIRHKAYERGLIDEVQLERLTDHEAINLVFLPGFSTAEQITDVSGRGVGMDVVRTAIAKVNGHIELTSERGKGTRLKLSLPLSMAVTNVMIVRAHERRFGIPMDAVVETVRVPRNSISIVKHRQTVVLRGRLVPLVALNNLLGLSEPPHANDDDAYATLVVRIGNEHLGILVDDFRETVDIILKPLNGILAPLKGYAGSALLGDGSVLLVLDLQELVSCSN